MAMVDSEELTTDQVSDTMDMIEGEFNDKAISLMAVKDNMQADVNAIDIEVKRLQGRKKAIQNKQSSMIEYLRSNMEASKITNIKCPLFSITLAKGRQVVNIEDESKIPSDYMDIKTIITPMKRELLADLKKGEIIEGVSIKTNKTSIRIT